MDRQNLPRNSSAREESQEDRGWPNQARPSLSPHAKQKTSPSLEVNDLLNRTIEAQIIPRLLISHGQTHPVEMATNLQIPPISSDDVKHFAELLIHSSNAICLGFIRSLRQEGHDLNEIYLDLIAPAARRLGCYWELDEQSFTTVTLALGRIQHILQELSVDFRNQPHEQLAITGKALLVAMPHSQHTMGVFMLSEFFIQAGWDVTALPNTSNEEILTLCRHQSFDLIGLSISYELQWEAMSQLIQEIRRCSANPRIAIMAGGALFNAKPELMEKCTADICTLSATDAVIAAENILKSRDSLEPIKN